LCAPSCERRRRVYRGAAGLTRWVSRLVRESACRSAFVRSSAPSGAPARRGASNALAGSPPRLDRPVWVFLAQGRLAAKTQYMRVGKAWISLDSLVRNEIYQWVTRDFRSNKFLAPLCRDEHNSTMRPGVSAYTNLGLPIGRL
jgi:hypothetical protein